MREDGKKVPPTFKDEVASGIGGSEAKLQHVKHQEFDQLTPSDQSDGIGSTSVASKPRSTKRRARRTYRYPAGPDDGAARHPKWKRPNALKSGVYSGAPLIPGEDPREFDKLHSDLINEWKPVGPTLRFALRRLAVSMWQMNRIEKFTQTKLRLASFEPQSPTFNEVWGFTMFIGCLRSEPEKSFGNQAKNISALIESIIWKKNSRGRITYPVQNGPRPSPRKSSQFYCQPYRDLSRPSRTQRPTF
jgi:hypothetical protein